MSVIYFITFVFDRIRMGIGMLLPIFSDAADFKNWNRWVRWGVHLLLLGLVLWGLYWVQGKSGWLQEHLVRKARPELKDYYLCLLFLLLYAACWIGYGLYRLLTAEEGASEFPELERAWRRAVADLERAGIRLNDMRSPPPVFLVAGRPAGGMDALFRAAGWEFRFRSPPERNSPLVVYACYEPYAVFVTAPDATGWTYLCGAVNGDPRYTPADMGEDADKGKTLSLVPGEGLQQFGLTMSENHELRTLLQIQSQQELTQAQRDRLGVLAEKGNRGRTAAGRPLAVPTELLDRGVREVRFLCELIKRDRWPLCPVNGLLVLVPWALGESDHTAQLGARELADNLAAVRESLQLHYPTVGLVCDLETARGFGEFRRAFAPEQHKQRLGKGTPLLPVRAPGTPPPADLIPHGVNWIGAAVMPAWILDALRLDRLGQPASQPYGQDPNRQLYLLLHEVHRRMPRFASILSQLPVGGGGGPTGRAEDLEALPLFGGCYLAGTGGQANLQAFVAGVFQRLVDDQGSVAWTRQARADDERFRWLTRVGYAAVVLLVIGLVAAAFVGR